MLWDFAAKFALWDSLKFRGPSKKQKQQEGLEELFMVEVESGRDMITVSQMRWERNEHLQRVHVLGLDLFTQLLAIISDLIDRTMRKHKWDYIIYNDATDVRKSSEY